MRQLAGPVLGQPAGGVAVVGKSRTGKAVRNVNEFTVFCSNHPAVCVQVLGRCLRAAVARGDVRPVPVLVPSTELRDRLRDDLAETLGVCGGVALLLPGEFLQTWLPRRLGLTIGLDADLARWRLCAALPPDGLLGDGLTTDLSSRQDAPWDGRRLALATRLREAFGRLWQWAPDAGPTPWSQGVAGPHDQLYPQLRQLWNVMIRDGNPLTEHQRMLKEIATCDDLPVAVLAYGVPDLSPRMLDVLAALAKRLPVQVILSQPTAGDWSDIARRDKDALTSPHRLLTGWGREHRAALIRFDAAGAMLHSDEAFFVTPQRSNLLTHIQADLVAGLAPEPRQEIDKDDQSVVFQQAFGPRSEVEGLAQRLAVWLQDGRIPAHQVCVVTPDPELYGPLLAGILTTGGEGPIVPVDGQQRRPVDPAVAMAQQLLTVVPGRWTASAVLALLQDPILRQVWSLTDDMLLRVQQWCGMADVRWGVDLAHQQETVPGEWATGAATWRRGLQRLAWSVYVGADTETVPMLDYPVGSTVVAVAPVPGLEERDGEYLEIICRLLEPLLINAATWRAGQTATAWAESIPQLVGHVLQDDNSDRLSALRQMICRWADIIDKAGSSQAVVLAEVVAHVVNESNHPAPIRAGGLTVGTVADLRGHAWSVVACLGMQDGAFPRQRGASDVDILQRFPVPGQPDPRHSDRAGLLDIVMSTEAHLLISWVGRDPRTGAELPPCAPIGDLLDVAARTMGCSHPEDLIVRIGLGPHTGVVPGPWPSPLRACQAQQPIRRQNVLVPETPLPAVALPNRLSAHSLARFLADPPALFLRRLGIQVQRDEELVEDHECVQVEPGLANWRLRDELTNMFLARPDSSAMDRAKRWMAEGRLPSRAWGNMAVAPIMEKAEKLLTRVHEVWQGEALPPQGAPLVLRIPCHNTVIDVAFSRHHPQWGPVIVHSGLDTATLRQRTWMLGLLWQAAQVANDKDQGSGLLLCESGWLAMPKSPDPLRALEKLLLVYQRGQQLPLPWIPEVVATWEEDAPGTAITFSPASAGAWIWPDGCATPGMAKTNEFGDLEGLGASIWSKKALPLKKWPVRRSDEP